MAKADKISYSAAKFRFAGPVYIDADSHYEPHSHPHHELVLVQRGHFRILTCGADRVAGPGDIALYPAGTIHEEWTEEGAPVVTWACGFHWDGLKKNHPVFCHDAHGRVQDMLTWLGCEHFAHVPWPADRSYGDSLLWSLLAELDRLTAHEPRQIVDMVRSFVRTNMSQPFTLEDLVLISGLSKSHLARLFRSVTGRTPMEDARYLRVEEARRLIQSTSMPLSEIGTQIGISDECYLRRLLKSLLGVGVRDLRPGR